MDISELIKMLEEKPKEDSRAPIANVSTLGVSGGRPVDGEEGEPSEFALNLDLYDKASGDKLLRHNEDLRNTKLESEAVSDFFSMNYLTSPQRVKSCTDERRLEFVGKTMDTSDYNVLHRSCELNPITSEIAAVELSKSFAKLREEDKSREEKNERLRRAGKRVDERKSELRKEMTCLRAAAAAMKIAGDKVKDYDEAVAALGCGPGEYGNSRLDVTKVARLFQKVKDSPLLRAIMDKAGRCRRFHQAQQRKKTIHGCDDMVGVILDGDIGRLLPSEMLALGVPELELDTMRRIIEKQAICRQYRGVEKVGRGPIVVCVDESGSMSGEPVQWAKAIALTLAYRARHEKRWCCLCGFAGGTAGTRIVLPPNKWNEAGLLDWLTGFIGGGTTLDVPVHELPMVWWPEFVKQGMQRGKSDLFLITDARVQLPLAMERNFLAWKKAEQVKTFTICIGNRPGDLARVSDEIHEVGRLGLDVKAVQRCLSL